MLDRVQGALLCVAVSCIPLWGHAGYVLVDDFDGAAVGADIATISTHWTREKGSSALVVGSDGISRFASLSGVDGLEEGEGIFKCDFSGSSSIGSGDGTIFFQVTPHLKNGESGPQFHVLGLAEIASGVFAEVPSGGLSFDADGSLRLIGDPGDSYNVGHWSSESTYNVWMVLNRHAYLSGETEHVYYTYSTYVQGGAEYETQTMLYTDKSFLRNLSVVSSIGIVTTEEMSSESMFDIDNLYVDNAGINLVSPIPEPSSMGLMLFVGVIGFHFRRRRFFRKN